jgi:hypothetical protein
MVTTPRRTTATKAKPKPKPIKAKPIKIKAKPIKAKATKAKPTKAKPTKAKAAKPKAAMFEGKPDDDLPGGWPAGWVKRVFERRGGVLKGKGDRYWDSPKEGIRLRSMVEVRKFFIALKQTRGNELKAKEIFKGIQL